MSRTNRAAQFAPFQALSGFSENVKETERIVEKEIELDDEAKEILDQKLNFIINFKYKLPITITYFVKDKKKEGGTYYKLSGIFAKIDVVEGFIILSNKKKIFLKQIFSIEL